MSALIIEETPREELNIAVADRPGIPTENGVNAGQPDFKNTSSAASTEESQAITPESVSNDEGADKKKSAAMLITPVQELTMPQARPFVDGSSSPLWGPAGSREAYVQAVKASRLQFAWNITETEAGVLLRSVDSRIEDDGSKITVQGEEMIAARSAVHLVKIKGWGKINVDGGSEAMLRAVALEAHDQGITVRVNGRELTDEIVRSYQEEHEQSIQKTQKR
jgi:hypothetical protein